MLVGAGIPAPPAAWFADLLALVGAAQAVEDQLASNPEEPLPAAYADYIAKLPADRFPNLVASAVEMTSGGANDRSEFALELLLRGLATYVESP